MRQNKAYISLEKNTTLSLFAAESKRASLERKWVRRNAVAEIQVIDDILSGTITIEYITIVLNTDKLGRYTTKESINEIVAQTQ